MKYLCFGYYDKGKFDGMTESERNAMFDKCFEYDDHLRASGHWAGGEALQGPETALTLNWKNGKVATTDGPYAETKEQLGGILVVEARDMNHAVRAHRPASGADVWQHFRDSAGRGHERNHEDKQAATETGRCTLKKARLLRADCRQMVLSLVDQADGFHEDVAVDGRGCGG